MNTTEIQDLLTDTFEKISAGNPHYGFLEFAANELFYLCEDVLGDDGYILSDCYTRAVVSAIEAICKLKPEKLLELQESCRQSLEELAALDE